MNSEPPVTHYGALLTTGGLYLTGVYLASVTIVLPYILSTRGVIWAAGLIYPAYIVGYIIGNAFAPPVVARSGARVQLVLAGSAFAQAACVVIEATAARTDFFVAGAFLTMSVVAGIACGINTIAEAEIVSRKLPEARRPSYFLACTAVGSLAVIVSTLLLTPFLTERDPRDSQVDLLWLGAAGILIAGIAAVAVGPARPEWDEPPTSGLATVYRDGWAVARSQPWFRQNLITQALFVPISLSATFYTLHSQEVYGHAPGNLHALVVFGGLGIIVGAPFWRYVFKAAGVRGMLVTSAAISFGTALICIVAEVFDDWSLDWVHGFVIMLSMVAAQPIFSASVSWISALAPAHDRATLIASGTLLVAVQAILLGGILGAIAHNASAIWPVVVILLMHLCAAIVATRAPGRSAVGPSPAPGAASREDRPSQV